MSTADPTLLQLLSQATRAFERELNRGLRAELDDDLRPAHYAVFRYLDPAGSRVTALAEAAGMSQQSMGELVTHMERRGYLERRVDPADRRARLVLLTEAGHCALSVAANRIRHIEAALAEILGERRLGDLRATLAEVAGGH